MSKSEQFREYAKEALDWALRSKTEKEREMLIYLTQTWTLAATWNDRPAPAGGDAPLGIHVHRDRPNQRYSGRLCAILV